MLNSRRGQLAAGVAVVLLLALVWLIFVPAADWLAHHDLGNSATGPQLQTARDAARGRLLTLGAGLLAAGALFFTARNFTLSREGQVTDRYTKAIEQLGSDKLDVRIGGIYALERVARDSARDHPTVMDVLAAFIREHSREPLQPSGTDGQEGSRSIRPDIQAAISVMGRRDARRKIRPMNLAGVYLPGAYLQEANLAGANLAGTDLTGADLWRADLSGANLRKAELAGTNLGKATLKGTIFWGAALKGANFTSATLTRASFTEADLTAAYFTLADLTEAYLVRADFTEARLPNANLSRAIMVNTNFTRADLINVKWSKYAPPPEGWKLTRFGYLAKEPATSTPADDTGIPT